MRTFLDNIINVKQQTSLYYIALNHSLKNRKFVTTRHISI